MDNNNQLLINNLSKIYENAQKKKTTALSQVNLMFDSTGLVCLLGHNGSGKTTLLNLLSSFDKPSAGIIVFDGCYLNHLKPEQYDAYRSKCIGFIAQEHQLLSNFTVYQNIELPLLSLIVNKAERENKVHSVMEQFNIIDLANKKVSELSKGQVQKVTIARAVVKNPQILLCDEPTGNLDEQSMLEMVTYLKKEAQNKLVILVTHNSTIANQYADRIIELHQGKIIRDEQINETNKMLFYMPPKSKVKISTQIHVIRKIKDLFQPRLLPMMMFIVTTMLFFVLSMSLLGMSKYDKKVALVQTIENAEQYIIPVTYSHHKSTWINGLLFSYGLYNINTDLFINYGDEYINTVINDVSSIMNHEYPVYPSYFFSKNLKDFFEVSEDTHILNQFDPYYSSHFQAITVVNDFETFHQPLRYGSYPSDDNDVIIYDYMAQMMIDLKYVNNTNQISDLVNYELIDLDTGLKLKISGILKSKFYLYESITWINSNLWTKPQYPFEERYLNSLQVIFCKPELLVQVQAQDDYLSIHQTQFWNNESNESSLLSHRKVLIINQTEHINLLKFNNSSERGILLSKHQYANMVNQDVDQVNIDSIDLEQFDIQLSRFRNIYTNQKMMLSGSTFQVIGVYDSDSDDENVLLLYDVNIEQNMGLLWIGTRPKMAYISLGPDWNKNKEILELFLPPETYTLSFYVDNPTYFSYQYMEDTPFMFLINGVNKSIQQMSRFGLIFLSIVLVIVGFITVFFIDRLIKKNQYQLGVLTSLGSPMKYNMILILSYLVINLMVVSLLSIVPSIILVSYLNEVVSSDLPFPLVFFQLKLIDFLIILPIIAGFSVVTAIYLYFKTQSKKPIQLMKSIEQSY